MTRSKDIGTAGETAVVKVLRVNGFPEAERAALRGNQDIGDITGVGPVCFEVKSGKAAESASDNQVLSWMAELDTECVHKGADVGVLVMKRKGVGHGNADRWWAVMWLADTAPFRYPAPLPPPLASWGSVAGAVPVRMTLADACRVLRALGYTKAGT